MYELFLYELFRGIEFSQLGRQGKPHIRLQSKNEGSLHEHVHPLPRKSRVYGLNGDLQSF